MAAGVEQSVVLRNRDEGQVGKKKELLALFSSTQTSPQFSRATGSTAWCKHGSTACLQR